MQFNPYVDVHKELLEHESMLQDLGHVLKSEQGQAVFKYLMKHFGVGELPDINIPTNLRDEYIGFLRAGKGIFDIVSQADTIKAGLLLAQIQKEKYDDANTQNSNGQR